MTASGSVLYLRERWRRLTGSGSTVCIVAQILARTRISYLGALTPFASTGHRAVSGRANVLYNGSSRLVRAGHIDAGSKQLALELGIARQQLSLHFAITFELLKPDLRAFVTDRIIAFAGG